MHNVTGDKKVHSKQHGFTLIEAMITVAVIVILATIAWPLYEEQSAKNRRTDGIGALITASNDMEKCYSDQATFTGCTVSATSPQGYYTISVNIPDADSYTLTATPKAEYPDPTCTTLTLNNLGVKGFTSSDANTTVQRCWSQ